jgi:SAM-dependent methyltransferase
MSSEFTYAFEVLHACEMCGQPDSANRLLGQRLNGRQGLRTRSLQGITTSIKRCTRCGLIYPNPLPIPASLEDHYDIDPQKYWEPVYFNYDPTYFQLPARTASSLLGVPADNHPWRSLDIGCGLGKAIRTLSQEGFLAYGLEPSPRFHQQAVRFTGLSDQLLQPYSVEEASFPDGFFDFITFGAVFEHLVHPHRCLQRALQWLRPGGVMHLEIPSSNWLLEHAYHVALKLKGSDFTAFLSPMHPLYHLYSFTRRCFELNQQNFGFEVLQWRIDPCAVYHLPRFVHSPLQKLMQVSNTGMQLTLYLRRL